MDAIDRDPMTAQYCQRLCHVHHGGIACSAAEIAGVALAPLMLMMRPQPSIFMKGMTARDSAALRHIPR
jgi:hypothetical protein